jgi:hypothetical protein
MQTAAGLCSGLPARFRAGKTIGRGLCPPRFVVVINQTSSKPRAAFRFLPQWNPDETVTVTTTGNDRRGVSILITIGAQGKRSAKR